MNDCMRVPGQAGGCCFKREKKWTKMGEIRYESNEMGRSARTSVFGKGGDGSKRASYCSPIIPSVLTGHESRAVGDGRFSDV